MALTSVTTADDQAARLLKSDKSSGWLPYARRRFPAPVRRAGGPKSVSVRAPQRATRDEALRAYDDRFGPPGEIALDAAWGEASDSGSESASASAAGHADADEWEAETARWREPAGAAALAGEATDCGYPGITETACLQSGCKWDDSVFGTPWCTFND